MTDTHLRLLRRIAAQRRRGLRRRAAAAPVELSAERIEHLAAASARADAQLMAATNRRRSRRAGHPAGATAES